MSLSFLLPIIYRHILAVVHFNQNLQREVKTRAKDGHERTKVVYPKFKNGEATVRNIKVKQKFDYVGEIYNTFLDLTKDQLKEASVTLQDMAPSPMNSAFIEKERKEDAIAKKLQRDTMVLHDVPPTTPGIFVT
ncbi:hypothetical protein QZH41_012640 [Actinostola sp. cb2023]|nr:hypothetical protein QZH41_012640 [Actinostola sp. cb2023]